MSERLNPLEVTEVENRVFNGKDVYLEKNRRCESEASEDVTCTGAMKEERVENASENVEVVRMENIDKAKENSNCERTLVNGSKDQMTDYVTGGGFILSSGEGLITSSEVSENLEEQTLQSERVDLSDRKIVFAKPSEEENVQSEPVYQNKTTATSEKQLSHSSDKELKQGDTGDVNANEEILMDPAYEDMKSPTRKIECEEQLQNLSDYPDTEQMKTKILPHYENVVKQSSEVLSERVDSVGDLKYERMSTISSTSDSSGGVCDQRPVSASADLPIGATCESEEHDGSNVRLSIASSAGHSCDSPKSHRSSALSMDSRSDRLSCMSVESKTDASSVVSDIRTDRSSILSDFCADQLSVVDFKSDHSSCVSVISTDSNFDFDMCNQYLEPCGEVNETASSEDSGPLPPLPPKSERTMTSPTFILPYRVVDLDAGGNIVKPYKVMDIFDNCEGSDNEMNYTAEESNAENIARYPSKAYCGSEDDHEGPPLPPKDVSKKRGGSETRKGDEPPPLPRPRACTVPGKAQTLPRVMPRHAEGAKSTGKTPAKRGSNEYTQPNAFPVPPPPEVMLPAASPLRKPPRKTPSPLKTIKQLSPKKAHTSQQSPGKTDKTNSKTNLIRRATFSSPPTSPTRSSVFYLDLNEGRPKTPDAELERKVMSKTEKKSTPKRAAPPPPLSNLHHSGHIGIHQRSSTISHTSSPKSATLPRQSTYPHVSKSSSSSSSSPPSTGVKEGKGIKKAIMSTLKKRGKNKSRAKRITISGPILMHPEHGDPGQNIPGFMVKSTTKTENQPSDDEKQAKKEAHSAQSYENFPFSRSDDKPSKPGKPVRPQKTRAMSQGNVNDEDEYLTPDTFLRSSRVDDILSELDNTAYLAESLSTEELALGPLPALPLDHAEDDVEYVSFDENDDETSEQNADITNSLPQTTISRGKSQESLDLSGTERAMSTTKLVKPQDKNIHVKGLVKPQANVQPMALSKPVPSKEPPKLPSRPPIAAVNPSEPAPSDTPLPPPKSKVVDSVIPRPKPRQKAHSKFETSQESLSLRVSQLHLNTLKEITTTWSDAHLSCEYDLKRCNHWSDYESAGELVIVEGSGVVLLPVRCTRFNQTRHNRFLAKLEYPHQGKQQSAQRSQFKQDLRVCESIEPHPNVSRVFTHFQDNIPCYVFKLQQAPTYETVVSISQHIPHQNSFHFVEESHDLHKNKPEQYERQVCLLLLQLFYGIEHLHKEGVVHRDLCLENLHLINNGNYLELIIANFGFALHQSKKTRPSPFVLSAGASPQLGGNIEHLPPEILHIPDDSETLNYEKCDPFAAGCLIYELLHLPNPFSEDKNLAKQDYSLSDLPLIPSRSCYSAGLQSLACHLLQQSAAERINASQAVQLLQILLWGPENLHQSPQIPLQDVRDWLELERARMVTSLATRYVVSSVQMENGVQLKLSDEDILKCLYLAEGTPLTIIQSYHLLMNILIY